MCCVCVILSYIIIQPSTKKDKNWAEDIATKKSVVLKTTNSLLLLPVPPKATGWLLTPPMPLYEPQIGYYMQCQSLVDEFS